MSQEQIEIQVVMDDGSIKKGFANIEKQGSDSANSLSLSYGKLAGIISAVGIGALFKKAISESAHAEESITRLNLAMRNNGTFSQAASESFQRFSETLQNQVGIDNDVINSNAAVLVSIGRLSGEGLERATKAAVDLAAGTGKDLGTAFDIVAKAANGNTAALGKTVGKIKEGISDSEKFAAALGQIEKRFGGVAASLASTTFEGALNKLSVSFGNLLEKFGDFFTKSPVLRKAIDIISESINKITKSLSNIKGDVVGNSIISLVEILIGAISRVGPLLEVFFRSIYTGFNTLVVGFDLIKVGILEASLVIARALGKNTEDIQASLDAAKAGLETSWSDLTSSADKTFNTDLTNVTQRWLDNYKSKLEEAKVANKGLADNIKQTKEESVGDINSFSEGMGVFADGFVGQAKKVADSARENFANAGKQAFSTFSNGVGQAFAGVGKALQKGENALQAFGDALLQTIGQIAVQLGTTFIAQGIAYIFAGLPNGPALIGAGAALATIGGILAATGGGSTASSTGGGVAGGVGSVGNDNSTALVAQETQKPGTNIEINVSGVVGDEGEVAKRLVDLVNTNFEKSGVTILKGAVA